MAIYRESQGPLPATTLCPRSGLEMGTLSSQQYTPLTLFLELMLELRRFHQSGHIEDEPRDPVMAQVHHWDPRTTVRFK